MFQYAICVSCLPGLERLICNTIGKSLGLVALYPSWTRELWMQDHYVERMQAVLPGYIFVYSDTPAPVGKIAQTENVYRVLHYGDGSYSLCGEDLAFAKWVYEQDGQIGLSRAVMVGDEMVIIDGPMKNYEGMIKRIDKHNRYAQIEIDLDGIVRTVNLSFQWMEFKDGALVRLKKRKGADDGT